MSLKIFHIVFIALSSLTSFGFALWCYRSFRIEMDDMYLFLGAPSLAFGVALIIYGNWFLKKMEAKTFS